MYTASRPAKILVVDDHPMMREGLALRISGQADMEVCGEAEDVDEALAEVKAKGPDLVIVDLSLRRGHGIDLIKQIKARDNRVKTLVVSTYEESLYAERCLRAGAMGYINKQECRENIIGAIRQVLEGKRYVSPEMAERLIGKAVGEIDTSGESPFDVLSDRELEIFHLIGGGLTTGEIAKQLHLSTHTIDSHREKMKAKLNLKRGAELTRLAVQWVLQQG